jgi:hypothetical protein
MRGIIFIMNESLKSPIEGHENNEPTLTERVVTKHGGIYDYGEFPVAVTFDALDSVYVSSEIADMLALALSAQDKVFSGRYPNLEKKLALINCRKAVFAVSEKMSVHEVVNESSNDLSAIEPLFADVKRMQEAGFGPNLITESYSKEMKDYLNEYDGNFPCAVHMFEFDKDSKRASAIIESIQVSGQINPEVLTQLHRIHSFIVLGESEKGYVCFQKVGPGVDMPFMIDHFVPMTEEYPLSIGREGVVFIGPIDGS